MAERAVGWYGRGHMIRAPSMVVATLALTGAGCGPNPYDEPASRPVCDTLDTDAVCEGLFGGSSSGSTTHWTTTTSVEMMTEGGGGSEGGSDGSGGGTTSGGSPGDADAGIWAKLSVSPEKVDKVGPVTVALQWSGPIDAVDLYFGDKLLLQGVPPAEAKYVLPVTSEHVPGNGDYEFRAVVHEPDRSAEVMASLEIGVPSGGTQVWKYSDSDSVSVYTSIAMLGEDVVVAGYVMKGEVPVLAVAVLGLPKDGQKVEPKVGPMLFEPISWSGESPGPAITVEPGGSVFVAATIPSEKTTQRVIYRLDPATLEPVSKPEYSAEDEDATALTLCKEQVVVAGSVRTNEAPPLYDLRVSWLSKQSEGPVSTATFAAPKEEDQMNAWSERAYGVACVDGEVVVVGTRQIKPDPKKPAYTRTVVLRYASPDASPEVWTSPGKKLGKDVLDEDAALAVVPTKDGGYAVTGWTRALEPGAVHQVLTRRFNAAGEHLWSRSEPTPDGDAIGRALGEDLEGKLIVAGSRYQSGTDLNAWIFAVPNEYESCTWEVLHHGTSNGPDQAYGLALNSWGYPFAAGVEFDEQVRAFALGLSP